MEATVAHFCNRIILLTSVASNKVKIRPNLPINFFPANPKCFPDKSYELLKIPVPINNVLSSHLSVSINAQLAVTTCKYFALLLRKQLIAISTLV